MTVHQKTSKGGKGVLEKLPLAGSEIFGGLDQQEEEEQLWPPVRDDGGQEDGFLSGCTVQTNEA